MYKSATLDLLGTDSPSTVATALPELSPSPSLPRLVPHTDDVFDLLPCRREDPELWFAERSADVERAKELCRTCPLQLTCLQGALEREEPWGVWGGEILLHGEILATKRGRGRPRKVTLG